MTNLDSILAISSKLIHAQKEIEKFARVISRADSREKSFAAKTDQAEKLRALAQTFEKDIHPYLDSIKQRIQEIESLNNEQKQIIDRVSY